LISIVKKVVRRRKSEDGSSRRPRFFHDWKLRSSVFRLPPFHKPKILIKKQSLQPYGQTLC